MPVVLILVDSLKPEYIREDYMPFTYGIASRNLWVNRIKPSFGFCERTEIFTGMKPQTSGNFSAIGYDPIKSEFKNYRKFLNFLSLFENLFGIESKIIKLLRFYLSKYFKRKGIKMGIYSIPLKSLPYFCLTEDYKNHFLDNAFNHESIIDILHRESKNIYTDSFTSLNQGISRNDESRVDNIIRNFDPNYDFSLLYLSNLDSYGHHQNIDKDGIKTILNSIDNQIKRVYQSFITDEPLTKFVILGDHGMVSVYENLNINKLLRHLNLKQGRDYRLFIDSTFVRFWFYNKNAEKKISDFLNTDEMKTLGIIVDNDICQKMKIPCNMISSDNSKTYGDLIWATKLGVALNPSYFGKNNKLQGMHGFLDISPESYGTLVIAPMHQQKFEEFELIDVCPTLSHLLNISVPNGNEGISILKTKL